MDTEAFVSWALEDARNLEERFAVETLVESQLEMWHHQHQTGRRRSWEECEERRRQQTLNPAYQPSYTETDLRRAAEILAERKDLDWGNRYNSRPLRDLAVLRFLPQLETLKVSGQISDVSVLAELPRLRELRLHATTCEDFRVLGRCATLRTLDLGLACHWPEIGGLEMLQDLEIFSLSGNLLVFPRGLVFPKVRSGNLSCSPLHARSVRDLPGFPACEFLALSGVERLDGIAALPGLRNLTLTGPVRDLAPLTALPNLTCLTYTGALPLDVSPLAALPGLQFAQFNTSHNYGIDTAPLRDYSPLAASPSLRELIVMGCPPVEMEVAALNAGFPSWESEFLTATPRPLPPLRMIVAPHQWHIYHPDPPPGPVFSDVGVRQCESRWVARQVTDWIAQRIGHRDWGDVTSHHYGGGRSFFVTIESYEIVERLPEIVETVRAALARLRHAHTAGVMIALRVPPPAPTPAQAELADQFRDAENRADGERRRREHQEYLDRLYLYNLKKEEGGEIDPEEFAVPPPEPLPLHFAETDEDEDEEGEGGVAVKHVPDPPPGFLFDDDHPLADSYRLLATITLDEAWFMTHQRDLAIHLMQREPDREIEPPPPPPE